MIMVFIVILIRAKIEQNVKKDRIGLFVNAVDTLELFVHKTSMNAKIPTLVVMVALVSIRLGILDVYAPIN